MNSDEIGHYQTCLWVTVMTILDSHDVTRRTVEEWTGFIIPLDYTATLYLKAGVWIKHPLLGKRYYVFKRLYLHNNQHPLAYGNPTRSGEERIHRPMNIIDRILFGRRELEFKYIINRSPCVHLLFFCTPVCVCFSEPCTWNLFRENPRSTVKVQTKCSMNQIYGYSVLYPT